MKILIIASLVFILFVYLLTIYRIATSKRKLESWKLLLVVFLPFFGCIIYLLTLNNDFKIRVSKNKHL